MFTVEMKNDHHKGYFVRSLLGVTGRDYKLSNIIYKKILYNKILMLQQDNKYLIINSLSPFRAKMEF